MLGRVFASLELPAGPRSPGEARRFVVGILQAWGRDDLEPGGELLATELVTNAVLHARTSMVVTLSGSGDSVRLAVRDGSLVVPAQRHYGVAATTGRGLHLVAVLGHTWGVESYPDGKTVWVDLAPEEATDPALLFEEAW